jgi:hypothetical protein
LRTARTAAIIIKKKFAFIADRQSLYPTLGFHMVWLANI